MAIQTLEELLCRSAAVFQQEQNGENNKAVDSGTASLPSPTAVSQQRRCEERVGDQQMCSYEIRETIGRGVRRYWGRRGFRGQSE